MSEISVSRLRVCFVGSLLILPCSLRAQASHDSQNKPASPAVTQLAIPGLSVPRQFSRSFMTPENSQTKDVTSPKSTSSCASAPEPVVDRKVPDKASQSPLTGPDASSCGLATPFALKSISNAVAATFRSDLRLAPDSKSTGITPRNDSERK